MGSSLGFDIRAYAVRSLKVFHKRFGNPLQSMPVCDPQQQFQVFIASHILTKSAKID